MFKLKRFNILLLIFALTSLWGCGGGDVSIIPSTDSFTQQGQEIVAKMDILWVIDNSGSMNNFQTKLQNNFNAFISDFQTKGYDFRMAVIATDAWRSEFDSSDKSDFKEAMGGLTVLDQNTPNLEDRFIEMAIVGTSGSGDERALQSIVEALEDSDNSGFHRSDAHLAIIIVSDEDDFSTEGSETYLSYRYQSGAQPCAANNPDGTINTACIDLTYYSDSNPEPVSGEFLTPVSFYDNYLTNFSSSTLGYSVYSMGVQDNACRVQNFPEEGSTYFRLIGQRTGDLANISGGILGDLCGDFANELSDIAATIIQRTVEFPLNDVPADPNALVVRVKNVGDTEFSLVPNDNQNGWIYSSENNSIIFFGTGIPAQGSEIQINYDPNSL